MHNVLRLFIVRHGVRQMRTAWADGPEFITQCPIRPGGSYTYRFTIRGQEGTLWWHAHSSWLRATVYGALIIYPKGSYPFPKPHRDAPIILGKKFTSNSLLLVFWLPKSYMMWWQLYKGNFSQLWKRKFKDNVMPKLLDFLFFVKLIVCFDTSRTLLI